MALDLPTLLLLSFFSPLSFPRFFCDSLLISTPVCFELSSFPPLFFAIFRSLQPRSPQTFFTFPGQAHLHPCADLAIKGSFTTFISDSIRMLVPLPRPAFASRGLFCCFFCAHPRVFTGRSTKPLVLAPGEASQILGGSGYLFSLCLNPSRWELFFQITPVTSIDFILG